MPKYGNLKYTQYLGNHCLQSKKSSISTHFAIQHMCNFANILYASFSLLYQTWHVNLEFACTFCLLVQIYFPTFLTFFVLLTTFHLLSFAQRSQPVTTFKPSVPLRGNTTALRHFTKIVSENVLLLITAAGKLHFPNEWTS